VLCSLPPWSWPCSVLLKQHWNTICTSVFVDDVTVAYNGLTQCCAMSSVKLQAHVNTVSQHKVVIARDRVLAGEIFTCTHCCWNINTQGDIRTCSLQYSHSPNFSTFCNKQQVFTLAFLEAMMVVNYTVYVSDSFVEVGEAAACVHILNSVCK